MPSMTGNADSDAYTDKKDLAQARQLVIRSQHQVKELGLRYL